MYHCSSIVPVCKSITKFHTSHTHHSSLHSSPLSFPCGRLSLVLEETEQAANKTEEANQILRSQLREKDETQADQLQVLHALEEEKNKAQVGERPQQPMTVRCAVLYSALLYSTLLYSTLLHSTLLYSTLLSCTLLYSPVLHSTLLYSTLLSCTLLYSTLLYSTLLHSTALYSTLLYSTLLYSTALYSTLQIGRAHV